MFKKVLVANRGEIAVRIIRTLKEMGITAVAIYSTADRDSLHVQLADEAVCVGGPRTKDSYLNMKNILAAAVGTGAEAIHPGYGFLSENAEFARLCEACGITFIGPRPATIDLMGNKEHAREQIKKAGVPVIPGSDGYVNRVTDAHLIAKQLGYPVLLKAAAGGGGKGIRRVASPAELQEVFEQAQQEARVSFGDDRMYLEKIMTDVKHIEVQVFRDQAGHVLYFPERDCSVQRNKQKVIEESPCQLVTPAQRQALGELAVKAVTALDYVNTGTLEFLMDRAHHFYFMEMNTRIQVEHTITEMVTGLDLVKMQVQVAAGADLPVCQAQVQMQGHALECRINAEDVRHHFRPSTGVVNDLYLPVGNLGTRIDTALYPGATISPYYDSMIAKVVAYGEDRAAAVAKMRRLLQEMVISGVATNQAFHLAILQNAGWLSGQATTNFLEQTVLPAWKEEKDEAL